MYDRALQRVIKATIEPEWEAYFEPNSYGFRPGRSCHDAVYKIKLAIQSKAKYVLDADIAKCFDRINHTALLQKLNYRGKVRQQIKSWLKSGVIDQRTFTPTNDGTPQGGVISPLLANIALHGLENMLTNYAKTIKLRYPSGKAASWQAKVKSLTFIRYADDFVVIHQDLKVVQKCKELISNWLSDIGLELKPSKTRIAHTLIGEQSEDGISGFKFLGYNIRQFPIGKHKSPKHPHGFLLGFRTLIIPSKESCKRHQEKIKEMVRKHKKSPQAVLINKLNPIIRGWCNYYKFSDANTMKVFSKQDFLVSQKLRAWGVNRCGNFSKSCQKYLHKIGNRIYFATGNEGSSPLRLLFHDTFESSSTEYVKVKGDKSPYDGDLIYWSTRMGRSAEMPQNKAFLLRKQKGQCNWCGLNFRNEDVLEIDHKIAKALGGTNDNSNKQIIHGHCHDEKTALDLIQIMKKRATKFFKELTREWSKTNYVWIDDIPVVLRS